MGEQVFRPATLGRAMSIRAASPADVDHVLAVMHTALAESEWQLPPIEFSHARKWAMFILTIGCSFVAMDGPTTAGVLMIAPSHKTWSTKAIVYESMHFSVLPAYRGLGIEEQLIAQAKAMADTRGLDLQICLDFGDLPELRRKSTRLSGFAYLGGNHFYMPRPLPKAAPSGTQHSATFDQGEQSFQPPGLERKIMTRLAMPADTDHGIELLRAAHSESTRPLPPIEFEHVRNWGISIVSQGCSFIALDRQQLVGVLLTAPKHKNWSTQARFYPSMHFYVLPDYRRLGVAEALIARAKAMADASGIGLQISVDYGDHPEFKDKFVQLQGFEYLGGNHVYSPQVTPVSQ